MNEINILSQITMWMPVGITILGIIASLLIFRFGYIRGIKKALVCPSNDYIMAAFYLSLLKKLEEKDWKLIEDFVADAEADLKKIKKTAWAKAHPTNELTTNFHETTRIIYPLADHCAGFPLRLQRLRLG